MSIKKKALLIGINYVNQPRLRLNGCINDVLYTASFLKTVGFKENEIKVCVDSDAKCDLTKKESSGTSHP